MTTELTMYRDDFRKAEDGDIDFFNDYLVTLGLGKNYGDVEDYNQVTIRIDMNTIDPIVATD